MFFSVSYKYNNPNSRLLYGTHRNSHLLYGCYLLVHIWLNWVAFCHMAQCSHIVCWSTVSWVKYYSALPFLIWETELSLLFYGKYQPFSCMMMTELGIVFFAICIVNIIIFCYVTRRIFLWCLVNILLICYIVLKVIQISAI